MDAAPEKRVLRRQARRRGVDRSPDAALDLADRLLARPVLRRARIVALYQAIGDEVPTQRIRAALEAWGVRAVYPRVEGEELSLREPIGGARLTPGYRGIAEPPERAPEVRPDQVDVFLVPGLLFDRLRHRLGRGGGHYDRLLARARPDALRVGLCYADRIVERLPIDPWDVAMHLVITEQGEIE